MSRLQLIDTAHVLAILEDTGGAESVAACSTIGRKEGLVICSFGMEKKAKGG